jgi:DNA modification methylase
MRPQKVQNKAEKAEIRKGTRYAKKALPSRESSALLPLINRIICGDAKLGLSRIPDQNIDLIVTSPPYNFGHAYAQDPLTIPMNGMNISRIFWGSGRNVNVY